jgi:hypothetical protein
MHFAIKLVKQVSQFVSHQILQQVSFLPSASVLSTFGLLLILNFSFLIFHCGLDVEDPTPPSPPVWVEKSLPEEWPERGIDAHESGGIYLEWEPNSEEDIVAYNIYRAKWINEIDSLGDYNLLYRLEVESMSRMEYIDLGVQTGAKYYYKLKSEDTAENLSEFSVSQFYTLLHQINIETMSPNGQTLVLDQNRNLSWRYFYDIDMEDYCLTVLDDMNEIVFRGVIMPENYVSSSESTKIPADIVLGVDHRYQWRIDIGAIYIENRETSGSESLWATFLYAGD